MNQVNIKFSDEWIQYDPVIPSCRQRVSGLLLALYFSTYGAQYCVRSTCCVFPYPSPFLSLYLSLSLSVPCSLCISVSRCISACLCPSSPSPLSLPLRLVLYFSIYLFYGSRTTESVVRLMFHVWNLLY